MKPPVQDAGDPAAPSSDAASTFQLLERANSGEGAALEALFARYLKPLQRWASGRLPRYARAANDTHDLVQDTLLNAFKRIGSFEPRREGAFQAYLRQAVMNRIRDELRRTRVRPAISPAAGAHATRGTEQVRGHPCMRAPCPYFLLWGTVTVVLAEAAFP